MASGGRIEFRVKGRSGHAALPHLTRDPMVASAHLLLALQTIVSRNVDPLDAAVITVATMQAGSAANQIADEAVMRGTMRTLRDAVRDAVEDAIRRVAAGVAQSCDVEIDVALRRGNPVTVNTPAERDLAADAVTGGGLPLRRDMAPAMTGEDFAWYLATASRAPSCGSATARRTMAARCTVRATTTTTRSCRRPRPIWPAWRGARWRADARRSRLIWVNHVDAATC